MNTKSSLYAQCRYCSDVIGLEDEGQHITMFRCQQCDRDNEFRHHPDPAPLPPAINNKRVEVIRIVVDSFARAAISVPLKYKSEEFFAWLSHVHESAQQTVNHLFGYQGRKTVMIGRKKDSAAVAPNGRAAVL